MKRYVTIDGGTTNTRLFLVEDGRVTDCIKLNVGARAGIENRHLLQETVKTALRELLERNGLCDADIACVIASGMITSEFGLCCLAHLEAPVGIRELHLGMHKAQIPEISSIPFSFIRGVKLSSDRVENFDVMRGEETELMGILKDDEPNCVYVLPGSHSKMICVNAHGRIDHFFTSMTGEMLLALSQQTILKDALNLHVSQIDRAYLLRGYDFCKQVGINQSIFKTRLLKTVFHCDSDQIYSYFLGTVLCGEVERICSYDAQKVVIGGQEQLKTALAEILRHRTQKCVTVLDAQIVAHSVALGAVRVFEADANEKTFRSCSL